MNIILLVEISIQNVVRYGCFEMFYIISNRSTEKGVHGGYFCVNFSKHSIAAFFQIISSIYCACYRKYYEKTKTQQGKTSYTSSQK